jgi:7-keto-8-aminopelargonate synthetase-like enzyme
MLAVQALRAGLQDAGLQVLGTPAPIVPVLLGPAATARRAARALGQAGLLANLVEYPAVAQNAARLRLLVMASHTPAQARQAAALLARALQQAQGGEGVETAAMGLDLLPAQL